MGKNNISSNLNFIRKTLKVLFVLSILSYFGAEYSLEFIVNKINVHYSFFNSIENNWVYFLWLPIPILSIILGFKYKKMGIKCTKNIVGGFIMALILILLGLMAFSNNTERNYSIISDFEYFLNLNLPQDGEVELLNCDTYFDDNKYDYTIIKIYYDDQDVSGLVNSIENNENWILSSDMKSELNLLTSFPHTINNDIYYMIYNETLDEYNKLPQESGTYEIYSCLYNISTKRLEIHKYKYDYR